MRRLSKEDLEFLRSKDVLVCDDWDTKGKLFLCTSNYPYAGRAEFTEVKLVDFLYLFRFLRKVGKPRLDFKQVYTKI